ncbi:CRP-like cAMP-binding protein [Bradyrhizobium sp. AZCC 1588]
MPHRGFVAVTPPGGIGNRLLAALPQADLDLLAPELVGVALHQDAVISRAGDQVDYVLFPHSGAISLMIDMADGHTVATAIVGREGALGTLSVFGPSASALTAIVRAAGTASRIPAPRFHAAFNRSPAIRYMIQCHVRRCRYSFSAAEPAMRCIRWKPGWRAGCSTFATASTRTSSRSPRRRCRKYSVFDERQ